MAVRPVGAEIELAVPSRPVGHASTLTTAVRFVRKKPLGAAGGVLMLIMLLTGLLADVLQTHDPIATDASATLVRSSDAHWLGTDHLGRDIFSRIVHGARVSLIVGIGSTLLGSVLAASSACCPATPAARPISSPSGCSTSSRACRCSCWRWSCRPRWARRSRT